MADPQRILIVDDDARLRELLLRYLSEQGFEVKAVGDGKTLDKALTLKRYHLLVLDLMLPDEDGLAILRRLRGAGENVPVILLTAKGDEIDRIVGLEMGADDYLPKPFVIAELVARVRALGRRGGESKATVLRVADLTLDTVSHRAQRGGKVFDLTAREFRLLEFLMRSAGRISGRMSIIEKVWDYNFDPGTNLVDVYVKRLREKIDDDFEPKLLQTVRGVGYVLKETP